MHSSSCNLFLSFAVLAVAFTYYFFGHSADQLALAKSELITPWVQNGEVPMPESFFGKSQSQLMEFCNEVRKEKILGNPRVELRKGGRKLLYMRDIEANYFEFEYKNGRVSRVRLETRNCHGISKHPWIESRQSGLYQHAVILGDSIEHVLRLLNRKGNDIKKEIEFHESLQGLYIRRAAVFRQLGEEDAAESDETQSRFQRDAVKKLEENRS